MNKKEVINRLSQLGIKPLKSLGQNFLIEEGVIHKICGAVSFADFDLVLEIGPGLGSLTENFKDHKEKLRLIELDKSLAQYWKDQGFDVFHGDALKYSWSELQEKTLLVSNLPYQISSRLLIEIFSSSAPVETMVLMFQKEVGQRIQALPEDKKDYGLLSIISDLTWLVRPLVKAPRQCFYPSPEVESVVLTFTKKDDVFAGLNKKDFLNYLKTIFSARRKKMSSSLKKRDTTKVDPAFLDLRPEQISPTEHLRIFKDTL